MGKHYIPKKYLRGFAADEAGRAIWMFDKVLRDWKRAAIDKVAQKREYFDTPTEDALSTLIENPAHGALDRLLATNQVHDADRELLSRYISVMLRRVPASRRRSMELVEPSVRNVVERYREVMKAEAAEDESVSHLLPEKLAHLDILEARYVDSPTPEVKANVLSPWPSSRIFAAVESMTWRIVKAPQGFDYLTSDNPAYFFPGLGIGSAESEITFPISSKLVLLASWQGEPGATLYFSGTKRLVHEVNRRIASGTERFVFSSVKAGWIARLCLKPNHYLSRIRWDSIAT